MSGQNAIFSPDGKRILTSFGSAATIWDARSGAIVAELVGHTKSIYWIMSFSQDGRQVATISYDRTTRIWNADTGESIAVLRHPDNILHASFSPDGRRVVTACQDASAYVWDVRAGKCISRLQGHTEHVFSAVFSPEGGRVLTASRDSTAMIWDAETGGTFAETIDAYAETAAFSADGRRLVTTGDNQPTAIWDAATGERISSLESDGGNFCATFSPDGKRVATGCFNGAVKFWDAQSGHLLGEIAAHKEGVVAVAYSPNGREIATASEDGERSSWIWPPAGSLRCSSDMKVESSRSRSPQTAHESPPEVWTEQHEFGRAQSGKCVFRFDGHTKRVNSVAFSADGRHIVTASDDMSARIWDVKRGMELAKLEGHVLRVLSAAFSADGRRIVTSSADKTVRVWDSQCGIELLSLVGHDGPVLRAEFSPDDTVIRTAGNDEWPSYKHRILAYDSRPTSETIRSRFLAPPPRPVSTSGR